MAREAAQAAQAVRAQLSDAALVREIADSVRQLAPRIVVTCARGSSDHAATFAKYLIESHLGIPTASAAPSINSLYGVQPELQRALMLVISQSGRSPDLLAAARSAREAGAHVVALCNSPEAPLNSIAHRAIPLRAGGESSVAATKSFIASLSAILHLVAHWKSSGENSDRGTSDPTLLDALERLPAELECAWQLDWGAALEVLRNATNLFVVARGYGLAIAQEAALKLKETCGLHAEAFSAAEVQHGPMALVRNGFPVLILPQDDATHAGTLALAEQFIARGAHVMLAGPPLRGAITLPTLAAHPVSEPLLLIQSFYRLASELAVLRGLNPDAPPHLRKVTETL
jgi:glucosamine--fructose-6-phosphate aminotransferase (isomerizing)